MSHCSFISEQEVEAWPAGPGLSGCVSAQASPQFICYLVSSPEQEKKVFEKKDIEGHLPTFRTDKKYYKALFASHRELKNKSTRDVMVAKYFPMILTDVTWEGR